MTGCAYKTNAGIDWTHHAIYRNKRAKALDQTLVFDSARASRVIITQLSDNKKLVATAGFSASTKPFIYDSANRQICIRGQYEPRL